MRDAEIEGPLAYRAHRIGGFVEAEIVPQAQRYRWQPEPAAAGAVVDHFVVAVGRRCVRHEFP